MAHETIHLGPGDRTRNKILGHEFRKPSKRALLVGALSTSGILAVGGGAWAIANHHESRTATPAVGSAPLAPKHPGAKMDANGLRELPRPNPIYKDLAPGQPSLAEKQGSINVLYLTERNTEATLVTDNKVWSETWIGGTVALKTVVSCTDKTAKVVTEGSLSPQSTADLHKVDVMTFSSADVCKDGKLNPDMAVQLTK